MTEKQTATGAKIKKLNLIYLFFFTLVVLLISCKPFPRLNNKLPSHKLFIQYMSYLEEILEKDFLWRSSANKKSEINKKFTENNIRLKERMEEVNADAMSLKKVLLTLPQEERTIFFREYNRKKVQIQMLTKQLNRKNHIIFKGLYQQIIPSNFKDFDIDF